ncbi:MAG: tetratricopeptide repeat protein [Marinifilaceae bacterium]
MLHFRRIICICCLLLWGCFAYAQQSDTILENKIASITNDTLIIQEINAWFRNNYRSKPSLAIHYCSIALQHAKKLDLKKQEAKILLRMGVVNKIKGNYKQALLNYTNSKTIYRHLEDSLGLAKIYNNIGILNRTEGNYPIALKNFLASLKIYENYHQDNLKSQTLNNIGLVYKDMQDFPKALYYYEESLALKEKLKKHSSLLSSYINLASINSQLKNFDKALEYHQKSLEYLQEKPNSIDLAKTYQNLGGTYIELHNYDLALQNLFKSLKIKEKLNNKALLTSTYSSIANAYYLKGNLNRALLYRLKSLQAAKETHNLVVQKNTHEELIRIYLSKKNTKKALLHFDYYEIIQDSLINQERIKQIAQMQEKFDSEKKAQQIALLEKESELQEIEVEKKTKDLQLKKLQRNSLLVLLLLIVSVVIWFSRSYYRSRRFNKLLHLQKARIEWHKQTLDQKNRELLESNQTKNKLFQIISHDLRSPLATVADISKLVGIYIEQKKYNNLSDMNEELDQSVRRVLNLTDNLLSWSLSKSGKLPYQPEAIDLFQSLKNNTETYQSVANRKKIQLESKVPGSILVYSDRNMLDTVIRNLINNAIKFTPENGKVTVGAQANYDNALVWVKDTGTGIPADQLTTIFDVDKDKSHPGTRGEKGNGLGLILCKEFVDRNKGEIEVESKAEEGTIFKITLPLYTKDYSIV